MIVIGSMTDALFIATTIPSIVMGGGVGVGIVVGGVVGVVVFLPLLPVRETLPVMGRYGHRHDTPTKCSMMVVMWMG
jgi:hypothetical protein